MQQSADPRSLLELIKDPLTIEADVLRWIECEHDPERFLIPCFDPPLFPPPPFDFFRDGYEPLRLPCSLGFKLLMKKWWAAALAFYQRICALGIRGRLTVGEFPEPGFETLTLTCEHLSSHQQGDLLVTILELISPGLDFARVADKRTGMTLLQLLPRNHQELRCAIMLTVPTGEDRTPLEMSLEEGDERCFLMLNDHFNPANQSELEERFKLTERNPSTGRAPIDFVMQHRLPNVTGILSQTGWFDSVFCDWEVSKHITGNCFQALLTGGDPSWDAVRLPIVTGIIERTPISEIPKPIGSSFFFFPLKGYSPSHPDLALVGGLGSDFMSGKLPKARLMQVLSFSTDADALIELSELIGAHGDTPDLCLLVTCFCLADLEDELRVIQLMNLVSLIGPSQLKRVVNQRVRFYVSWATLLHLLANAGISTEAFTKEEDIIKNVPEELLAKCATKLRTMSPTESSRLTVLLSGEGFV